MSSHSSHGSDSSDTELSEAKGEVEARAQETENLATECSKKASTLAAEMDDLVASINEVLERGVPEDLAKPLREMKPLCQHVGESLQSIGSWDKKTGQTIRLLEKAEELEREKNRDLERWNGLSGDLAGLNLKLKGISSDLDFDSEKINDLTTNFEHTFVVSQDRTAHEQ
jgi:chromosome segregation ATPase